MVKKERFTTFKAVRHSLNALSLPRVFFHLSERWSPRALLKHFLHLPCIVETDLGVVIGVLLRADVSVHGNLSTLLVHDYIGSWYLIRDRRLIKSARGHT
jgi:hypothetical protein